MDDCWIEFTINATVPKNWLWSVLYYSHYIIAGILSIIAPQTPNNRQRVSESIPIHTVQGDRGWENEMENKIGKNRTNCQNKNAMHNQSRAMRHTPTTHWLRPRNVCFGFLFFIFYLLNCSFAHLVLCRRTLFFPLSFIHSLADRSLALALTPLLAFSLSLSYALSLSVSIIRMYVYIYILCCCMPYSSMY